MSPPRVEDLAQAQDANRVVAVVIIIIVIVGVGLRPRGYAA
jgi:hypothetical protein